MTLNETEVGPLHLSLGELLAQVDEGLGRLRDHQQSRRPLVETMHDTGARGLTQSLCTEEGHLWVPGEQTRHERALTLAGSGVHYLAGRFVHHRKLGIVEDDVDDH